MEKLNFIEKALFWKDKALRGTAVRRGVTWNYVHIMRYFYCTGPAPRDVYPCVLVLQADQETILTVIHVQDLQCTVPSQVNSCTGLNVQFLTR